MEMAVPERTAAQAWGVGHLRGKAEGPFGPKNQVNPMRTTCAALQTRSVQAFMRGRLAFTFRARALMPLFYAFTVVGLTPMLLFYAFTAVELA